MPNIDGALLPVICCGLCVVGVVALIGLQLVGVVFELIGGLVDVIGNLFGIDGGCGCVVGVIVLIGCALLVLLVLFFATRCTPESTGFLCALLPG
jgi:ABC-type Na+ efflux pump permease subunit